VASRSAIKFTEGDVEPQPATAARRDLEVMISNATNFAASCTWTRTQENLRKAVTLADGMGRQGPAAWGRRKPRERVAANCSSCAMPPQGEATGRGCQSKHKRRLLAVGPLYRRTRARLAAGVVERGTFGGPDPFDLAAELARERAHNQLS
jgi:hypothetical protein